MQGGCLWFLLTRVTVYLIYGITQNLGRHSVSLLEEFHRMVVLVLPLSGTPFYSFLLLSSPFHLLSFPLLLSSFLEGNKKYVISCVIQHEAGGLSKRVASPPDAGDLSAQNGVFFEKLSNASATSTANGSRGASSDYGVNGTGKQSAVLPAAESRRLAEYIPGPQRQKILEGLTGGEERRRPSVFQAFVQAPL